jgi:hypothetical protein
VTQVKGIELVVEGRTFVQEPPTFEQEMYIMQRVMESGFDQPAKTLGLDPETNDLSRSVKLLIVHAYKSGVLFDLLGALVVEKGTEWSPESAAANGKLFKNTRDQEAKNQLHPALVAAVTAFFLSANSLETTSPTYLDDSGESSRLNGSVTIKPKVEPKTADRLFSSGNTDLLSERSPSTKKSRPKKSSGGKSVRG